MPQTRSFCFPKSEPTISEEASAARYHAERHEAAAPPIMSVMRIRRSE